MPITAERMQSVISIAVDCTEIVNQIHQFLAELRQDIFLLDQLVENDGARDTILGIKTTIDNILMLGIGNDRIQNLMFEKAKFEINYKKNQSARKNMQAVRMGLHIPVPQKSPSRGRTTTRPMTDEEIRQDYAEYEKAMSEQAAQNPQLEISQLMTEAEPGPEPQPEPEPEPAENVITTFRSGDTASNPPYHGWIPKKKAQTNE